MEKIIIFGTKRFSSTRNLLFFIIIANMRSSHLSLIRNIVPLKYSWTSPTYTWEQALEKFPSDRFGMFVAIGPSQMNNVRKEKFIRAKAAGYKCVSFVSERASYLTQHEIGENCFIFEDNTIQPYVKICDNTILWSGNHIGHDSFISSHTFITSHVVVSGHVTVEENCFLGVNATIHDHLRLARYTLVGAGAVIGSDTKEYEVYVPERSKCLTKKSTEIDL
jgi:sugar O-acyltransferase (sialic acid O-acetyltransferase NeuD family)